MAIVVDPGLLDDMASHSGACTFVVEDIPEAEAIEGLRAARRTGLRKAIAQAADAS